MNLIAAFFCVLLFSLTVPVTRIAVLDMPPMVLVCVRLLGAALLCGGFIAVERWLPPRRAWRGLLLTSLGSVLGFSIFTAFAMEQVPSSHGALALAAVPIVTAAYSAWRDGSSPGAAFWTFAGLGTLLSGSFFLREGGAGLSAGDGMLVLAVLSAALGYVEGGILARDFGGRRVMCWAILLAAPPAALVTLALLWRGEWGDYGAPAWSAALYLAVVTQSLAMFLWNRVLAVGPMQQVALVQLVQPFLTLAAAVLMLGEQVHWSAWLIAAGVVLCILGANRNRRMGRPGVPAGHGKVPSPRPESARSPG